MKKSFKRKFLESICFLVLLCALIVLVSQIVERKTSYTMFGGFIEEPEAYDVLFFGDSQAVTGVVPLEMWEEYGIAGYNLSSYSNIMPLTYWTMINALDYASPKLVVIGVNGLYQEEKISRVSSDVHTAMDYWPLSVNKMRMIEDLFCDPENPDYADVDGNRYQDLKWEYVFTLGKYHSRWSELTKEDFSKRPSYIKGGEFMVGVHPIWDYTLTAEDDFAEEFGYGFAYLRMAIEACTSRGIDVMLVHMPSPVVVNSQRCANTARSIADEYGIAFIDATLLDSIVDYAVDCFDQDPHLNTAGTLKMTEYLGSYIHANYDLPDRRGDERYAHWESQLNAYKDEKMKVMRSEKNLENVLMLLHDRDYDFRLFIHPDAPIWYDELSILLMHNIARERVLFGEENVESSSFMFPLAEFDRMLEEGNAYYLCREAGVWMELTADEAEAAAKMTFGKDTQAMVLAEVRDRRTGEKTALFEF